MKVFHVPGFKKGLSIADMEGEVKANIIDYNGVELSPNYPWKIQLSVEQENGRTRKFFVHLVRIHSPRHPFPLLPSACQVVWLSTQAFVCRAELKSIVQDEDEFEKM